MQNKKVNKIFAMIRTYNSTNNIFVLINLNISEMWSYLSSQLSELVTVEVVGRKESWPESLVIRSSSNSNQQGGRLVCNIRHNSNLQKKFYS